MNISIYVYILAYALLAWFLYTRVAPVKGLKHLTAAQFQQNIEQAQNPIVIDVRHPHEYHSGHMRDAVNIPLSRLKSHLNNIAKDREIFLYCRSGMRSRQAARMLSKKGYSRFSHLHGGILSWEGKIVK